jgi:hypothetical protein
MKRTFIGAALAFTFAPTGPGSDDAANPLPPANVAPDGVVEQQPSTDAADQEHGPTLGKPILQVTRRG